ncbi:MAG: hypothetical protein ABSA11_01425 [Candidatus Bathyarchaeia archaeon]
MRDTTTFTDRNLRFLIDAVSVENMIQGTDWPAPMAVEDPCERSRNLKSKANLNERRF